jgi:4-hydroxy-tetrahydrodipicolinate reductase
VTKLAICGAGGRMGQTLARLVAESADLELVAGIDREAADGAAAAALGCRRIVTTGAASSVLGDVDVVIDFSAPAATRELLQSAGDALAGRALVVGTTGLDEDIEARLADLAGRAAVLTAANFSPGVNLLEAVVKQVASVLAADSYDVEIVEAHHKRKVDAPSGTALTLAQAVAQGRSTRLDAVRRDGRSGSTGDRPGGEIGLHAVRGGGIVGDHAVLFMGDREQLELKHRALDRSLFADGALGAARWIAGRAPGRYSMADVLGLK